jgi:hypothetical protein
MKIKKTQNLVIIVLFLLSLPGSIGAQADRNHFCGDYAGYYNTTGNWNTFCGDFAGYVNTTGSWNTFCGNFAGRFNTTGNANSFFGFHAGLSNTTGYHNTFLGVHAGNFNTTGIRNTFVGYDAGYSNTTGGYNTFLGKTAGYSNTIGMDNTFLGMNAGCYNTEGTANTFLGREAGCYNTTGNYNTFLGRNAGYRNTTGSGNVFLGYNAGFYETGSDKLYIANGSASGDVLIYGDFSSGKVGINTTSPYYELDVNGTICGTFCSGSDIRLKKDVKPIEKALDQIARLRGVTFHWKDKKNDNGQQVGVIAQEVEKVFPQVVSTGGSGYKSVAYSNLVAPLIEAVKELKTRNEKAIKAIKELKAENETLKARLEAIEKKLKD